MTEFNRIIIYEIFPRNHGKNGNFEDIIEDLQRIKSLSVDIIWLMPIHPIGHLSRKGVDGSPYSIQDYKEINPSLGTLEQFQTLISEIHKLDMKIIMDAVLNHTSRDSSWLQCQPEYYFTNVCGQFSRKVPDWSDIYDLDYNNKILWHVLTNIMSYWVKLGIDGFRCDVASMIPIEFWEFLKKEIDCNNNLIWIAESVHFSHIKYMRKSGYLCHSDAEMHPVFNFTYEYDSYGLFEKFLQNTINLETYLQFIKYQMYQYPDNAIKLRFLENHDTDRAASIFKNYMQLQNWTVFTFFIPGASLIYAGQEYAMIKKPNLFNIDKIDWQKTNNKYFLFFQKVVSLAKRYTSSNLFFDIFDLGKGVVRIKWQNHPGIQIFLNLSDENRTYQIPEELDGINLLTGKKIYLQKYDKIKSFPLIVEANN